VTTGAGGVQQYGTITPGHIAVWQGDHSIQDGGPIKAVAPESCGAKGDGTTNDGPALAQCDAQAVAANSALLLSGVYRVAGNLALSAPDLFYPTASLKPDSGVTITLNGLLSAPDTSVIFIGAGSVLTPNMGRVSVAWWGATPAAADSVPAFRAAMASNRKIYCPPGNYIFNSVQQTRPRPTLNYSAVYISGLSNFELDCTGANILPGPGLYASVPGGGAYGFFEINNNSTDFYVHGFQFNGDYHSAGQNTAFALFGVQRFTFDNLNFSGNWGGVGNPFVNTWGIDGVFSNIKMANVGVCFDFGYVVNYQFRNITAHGSDGAGGAGLKCFSIVSDVPNAGTNPIPKLIPDTIGYVVSDSDISNFGGSPGYYPISIIAGQDIRFHGNYWHDNPGISGSNATVAMIEYWDAAGSSYPSIGTPPHNISWVGDTFVNNGTNFGLPVIDINSTRITNSDHMGGFVVSGCLFISNSTGAFFTIGTASTNAMTLPVAWGGSGNNFGNAAVAFEVDQNVRYLGLIPGSRQMFNGNSGNYAAAGTTAYTWGGKNDPNENNVKALSAYSGVISNLQVFVTTPPGAGQSVTATVLINSANPGGVACTISGTNTRCNSSILNNYDTVVAGDGLSIQLTSTGAAAPTMVFWGLETDSYN
jgi:hypothetical protein